MSVESSRILNGYNFEITSHDFKVLTDVPENQGGENKAPSPHDYIEIALASCTAITVQMYAKRKGIPLEYSDVKVQITSEGSAGNEIHREIRFVGNLTDEQKKNLLMIAEKCPIHKFLSAGAKIKTEMAG
ncbi:OsmC family protein [uncultured Bdellovibrio sp.]|uniref:OsmC family protein n=1 Tax=Bdellovibrio sp. HCB-162 TaxID=3394234 RepID=UPI0025F88889|nr:OsmC family protein [uncultured Bdellovibrio sp.]